MKTEIAIPLTLIAIGVTAMLVIYFAENGKCVRFGSPFFKGDVNCK